MPEKLRVNDSRVFTPPVIGSTFAVMSTLPGDTVNITTGSRWAGVLKASAYMVGVPANWNGKLVLFAHGYAGTGPIKRNAAAHPPPFDPVWLCVGSVQLQYQLL